MIRLSDGGFTVLSRENVVVGAFRMPLTLEQLRLLRKQASVHFEKYGSDRVSLSVIEPAAMVAPDDEVRAEAAALARDLPVRLDAMVLEGGGFRAAGVRAVINGLGMLTGRSAHRRRTFATVDAAIEAVLATGCVKLSKSDLLAMVTEARRLR